MNKILLIILFLIPAPLVAEEEVRECSDVLVDEVTDMAFADQGQPFTGKVNCYYDKEKSKLKSVRIFIKGIPTGSHHCHRWDGVHSYTIIYRNGKRYKRGYFIRKEYHTSLCLNEETSIDWCIKKYKSDCF